MSGDTSRTVPMPNIVDQTVGDGPPRIQALGIVIDKDGYIKGNWDKQLEMSGLSRDEFLDKFQAKG